jgi:16S rRNA (cytosine967-C5)-methyltransferase
MNARARAARALLQVIDAGRSLTEVLTAGGPGAAAQQRALVQELVYGTLRWYYRLNAQLEHLLERPLKRRHSDIRCLLLSGLYQLSHMDLPAHVAVNETVQACRELDKGWAAALVNAILRSWQRESGRLEAAIADDPQARHAHPRWLIECLQRDWPQDWEGILEAANLRPPFSLRVNRLRLSRAACLERLQRQGIPARTLPHTTDGIVLDSALPVSVLPGFAEGALSVQDGAAQQAAVLLDLRPGQRVLDACAAPGGKTAHILEVETRLESLTAVDIEPRRVRLIEDNLSRLGLAAGVLTGDAGDPSAWWDGRPFDRILLDVPCSATGVIRRHPDIKLLRRPADIERLVARQAQLLEAVWPLLSTGGMLLYSTCSILAAENEQQIGRFLSAHPEAREVQPGVTWGRSCTHGRQLLPGEDDMDGFYYACVYKTT